MRITMRVVYIMLHVYYMAHLNKLNKSIKSKRVPCSGDVIYFQRRSVPGGHSSVTWYYVTLFVWKLDPHPPPRNANNIEPYTFVMLFPGKIDTPHPHLRYVTLEWPPTSQCKLRRSRANSRLYKWAEHGDLFTLPLIPGRAPSIRAEPTSSRWARPT